MEKRCSFLHASSVEDGAGSFGEAILSLSRSISVSVSDLGFVLNGAATSGSVAGT